MSDFFHMPLGLNPVWPSPIKNVTTAVQSGSFIVNAASAKAEVIFQIQEQATIRRLGFLYNTSQNQPPKQRISLQGVTASLTSDGVTFTAAAYTPPAAGSIEHLDWKSNWRWVAVPEASFSRGQLVALVIEYDSGFVDAINTSQYSMTYVGSSTSRGGFPFVIEKGIRRGDRPIYGYQSVTRTYGTPCQSLQKEVFGSPKQRGLRFVLNSDYGQVFRVAGVIWQGSLSEPSNNESYFLSLYSGTNLLTRSRVDADFKKASAFKQDRVSRRLFTGDELPELEFGMEYIVAIDPQDTGSAFELTTMKLGQRENMSALIGGDELYFAKRDSQQQGWAFVKDERPLMDLIISEWGSRVRELKGVHIKVTPKYNDPTLVQHGDDQIESNIEEVPVGEHPHEFLGIPIGRAIESYSGYVTVEVFKDPDVDRSFEFMIHPEQPIEELKFIRWDPWVDGVFQIVFRLRAKDDSATFKEVIRYVRIIT